MAMGQTPASARILVVDDDATNRTFVRRLLEGAGMAVVVAENGVEALRAFEAGGVDLILMDRTMPEMDGLSATRALRATDPGATVPIIGLTGDADPDSIRLCEEAGMDFVIGKPVDFDELVAIVTDTVGVPMLTPHPSVGPRSLAEDGVDPEPMRALLARFGPAGFAELIGIFHDTLAEGAAATAAEDRAGFARIAHSLKSSAAQLGLAEFARLCRDIEAAGGDPGLGAAFRAAADDARLAIALNRPDLAV